MLHPDAGIHNLIFIFTLKCLNSVGELPKWDFYCRAHSPELKTRERERERVEREREGRRKRRRDGLHSDV